MKQMFTFFIVLLVIGWVGITDLNAQTRLYGMTQFGGADGLGTIFHYTPSTGAHTLDISLPAPNTGDYPQYDNGLTDGGDGYFYGMTNRGGKEDRGIIFQWNPVTNAITKKLDFSEATTGGFPYGSLTLSGGKFYGMTSIGGANSQGVIFEWDQSSNTFNKKIDFDGTNGSQPYGSLTFSGGKFYGMTLYGGVNGVGVIFEWDPSTNTFSKKIDFDGTNGSQPYGSLTLSGGKFYGMTRYGGLYDNGVIFEWDPATNGYNDKYDFDGTNGSSPTGSLLLSDGNLYGMTSQGGTVAGVIFKWNPVTNLYSTVVDFGSITDGIVPYGSLTLSGGKFYGMTCYGGSMAVDPFAWGAGVIFEWDPVTGYSKKHDFNGLNGAAPMGSLTLSGGKFYGMTQNGGTSNRGVIFEWDPVAPAYTKKIDFVISPNQPCGSLSRKGDKFYGMTYEGGANNVGVIIEYDPATNTLTKKFDFVKVTGAHPINSLTLVGDKFYGMTFDGGTSLYNGVIFEWDPLTNTYIDKYNFNGTTSGSNPLGSLTLYGGKLYGMTANGGAKYNGVLFEWDPTTNTFTKIWDFDTPTGNRGDGALTLGGNKLYGMTNYGGGPKNFGGIFELDPATNVYTQKQAFDGTTGFGHQNSLTLSNGKFYGVSQADEVNWSGVIFEWDPLSNVITPDKYLDYYAGGYLPWGSLTMSNGKFYGLTGLGGTNDLGVIYEWDPVTNIYIDKFDFDGPNGAKPYFTTLLEYTPPDTWTGAVNNDWATAGNWSSGTVPTPSSNVFIPDVANDPVIGSGTLAEAYDISIVDALVVLTINSGGSLTMNGILTNAAGDAGFVIQSGGSFKHTSAGANGTAVRTIQKDNKWHFLSCPVNQPSMPEICDDNFAPVTFNAATGATYDFLFWRESFMTGGLNWINLKNPDWSQNTTDFGSPPRFVSGKGYLVEYKSIAGGNPDKQFSGTFGVGAISIPVTKSAGGNTYNLIGNVYPSYIDWKAFGWDRSSLEDDAGGKVVWIWNDAAGNYGVYNSASAFDAGTNGVTRYIAPEQGFFVKAATNGNVTMTDDVRCHSTQAWLKAVGNNLSMVVSSSINEYSDEVMLEFGHQVTGGAEKWFSMYSEAPSLFLPVGEDMYSLRFLRDVSENPVIPMSFKAGQNGNYSITANGMEDFTNVILQDLKTGTSQEMKTNPVYNFTSITTDDVNRFLLKFNAVGIETQEKGNNAIYVYNNLLSISNPGESVIQVYNMMGQKILEKQSKNEALFQMQLQVTTGYYIVRLTTSEKVCTEKVFIK